MLKKSKKRTATPLKTECKIYPPESGARLIVEIPDEVAKNFAYEDMTAGQIAVPYNSI